MKKANPTRPRMKKKGEARKQLLEVTVEGMMKESVQTWGKIFDKESKTSWSRFRGEY